MRTKVISTGGSRSSSGRFHCASEWKRTWKTIGARRPQTEKSKKKMAILLATCQRTGHCGVDEFQKECERDPGANMTDSSLTACLKSHLRRVEFGSEFRLQAVSVRFRLKAGLQTGVFKQALSLFMRAARVLSVLIATIFLFFCQRSARSEERRVGKEC